MIGVILDRIAEYSEKKHQKNNTMKILPSDDLSNIPDYNKRYSEYTRKANSGQETGSKTLIREYRRYLTYKAIVIVVCLVVVIPVLIT